MNIELFETKEVKIYKKAEELNKRKQILQKAKNVLHDNYDSKLVISAYAYSSYNGNASGNAKEDIPLDILFEIVPSKKEIEEKLNHEINKIDAELIDLHNTLSK